MNDYVIFSDATLDLPNEIIVENDVHVIPMQFVMNDHTYTHYPDEREISNEEFYEKLKDGGLPTTTQINPLTVEEYLTPVLEEGKDIIYIVFTTGLSGTYQSALIAKEELEEKFPERKIYMIDSYCASAGEGMLVYQAIMKKKEGLTIDELNEWVLANRNNVRHWFCVNDLYHLKRGGRVSAVEAAVGSALKIKPVLTVDDLGRLDVAAKARGEKKSREYLLNKIVEEGVDTANQMVMVGHAVNPEMAESLKEEILSRGLAKEVIITKIGPIIGAHVGPGMFAVLFMGEKK